MFEEIIETIENYDSIVIFGHARPDGDCYGTQIGLREIIKANYPDKKVYAVGSGLPQFFPFLGHMDSIGLDIIERSLAILVDTSRNDRLEDQRYKYADGMMKIDHHIIGEKFNDVCAIDEEADSVCSMIVRMVLEQDLYLPSTAASALMLGILTDTGRFQFGNDFPTMFDNAAFLTRNGADIKKILSILNETDEKTIAFKGFIYTRYEKTEAGVVYLILDQETLNELGITFAQANEMVNTLGNIKGYPVWAFFVEDSDHSAHVELRSNRYAVEPIASRHGGGGHVLAAGCTIPVFDLNIINEILDECDSLIINGDY